MLIYTILKQCSVPEKISLYCVMVWLFNPFTFTIGTRGNCEPIVCAIILWIITCLIKGMFLFLIGNNMGATYMSVVPFFKAVYVSYVVYFCFNP